MTPTVQMTPSADRDLDRFAEFLSKIAGRETALRFVDSFVSTFENHRAFYRPVECGVEVIRVLHGLRDLNAALEAPDGLSLPRDCFILTLGRSTGTDSTAWWRGPSPGSAYLTSRMGTDTGRVDPEPVPVPGAH